MNHASPLLLRRKIRETTSTTSHSFRLERNTIRLARQISLPYLYLCLSFLAHHALISTVLMSLHEVWQAAASSPFQPTIGKESQLTLGLFLLFVGKEDHHWMRRNANEVPGLILTVLFGLSTLNTCDRPSSANTDSVKDRSTLSVPAFGIPASLAFGYVWLDIRSTSLISDPI